MKAVFGGTEKGVSKSVRITSDPSTNTVFVVAPPTIAVHIERKIVEAESHAGQRKPRVMQVHHGDATAIAETLGGFLVQAHPRDVTVEWSVEKRAGKVFFDANQNARIKNLAAVYSPRAKAGAPVSMPLRWDELSEVYPTDFTILNAPARIEQRGDLWAGILDAKHDLQALLDSV